MQAKEVVCLVFQQGDEVLLEQRLDEDLYHGSWTFPGGKVEDIDCKHDEGYLFVASVREAGEETGLKPEEIRLFTSFRAKTRHGNQYLFHGVYVQRFSGSLHNKELGRRILAWKPFPEAEKLVSEVAVDKRILGDFLIHLENLFHTKS